MHFTLYIRGEIERERHCWAFVAWFCREKEQREREREFSLVLRLGAVRRRKVRSSMILCMLASLETDVSVSCGFLEVTSREVKRKGKTEPRERRGKETRELVKRVKCLMGSGVKVSV